MQKSHTLKKLSVIGSLLILGCSLGGCSINNLRNNTTNHNNRYVKPARQTLHGRTVVQPITVDFYDSSHPDILMKEHIDNYLDSIKNPQDYSKPKFSTTNVSLDGKNNGDQAETEYVYLYRK